MKNLGLLALILLFLSFGMQSCSQRYGYISKVKAPKKQENSVAKAPVKRTKSVIPVVQESVLASNSIAETPLTPDVINNDNVSDNFMEPQSNTKETISVLPVMKRMLNPYKSIKNKTIALFKPKNSVPIASGGSMQFFLTKMILNIALTIGILALLLGIVFNVESLVYTGAVIILVWLIIQIIKVLF